MSRLHLLILWALAIIAGVIYFQRKDVPQNINSKTKLEIGSDLVAGDLVETIDGFKIADGDETVTVKKIDGEWSVVEQDGFPANINTVSRALRALRDAKVAQGVVASEEYFDRFDLDPEAEAEDERPDSITFISGDAEGPTLFLGKTRQSTGGSRTTAGRFVRLSDDDSGVYIVPESFSFLNFDPGSWIEKILTPLEEKPLEVEVTAPNDESFKSWKVSRKTVMDDFLLTDLGEKEVTKTNETSLLKNSFVRAPFTEIVSPEDYEKRADKKGIRTVKATDSAGSTFEITITPEKKDEKKKKEDDANSPVPVINYLISIKVLNGPAKPEPPAEDATVQEKAVFQERVANLEDLSRSVNRMRRIYEGRYFLVNTASVTPFLKNRGELVKPKEEKKDPVSVTTDPIPVPNPNGTNPLIPGNNPKAPPASIARPMENDPKKPKIEAVTPPIRVPPLPKKPGEGTENDPAKPDAPVQPAEAPKPAGTPEPTEAPEPAQAPKPEGAPEPAQDPQPTGGSQPEE